MKQKDWKSQETMFWKIKPETQRRWMQDTRSPKQSCLVQKKTNSKASVYYKIFSERYLRKEEQSVDEIRKESCSEMIKER